MVALGGSAPVGGAISVFLERGANDLHKSVHHGSTAGNPFIDIKETGTTNQPTYWKEERYS